MVQFLRVRDLLGNVQIEISRKMVEDHARVLVARHLLFDFFRHVGHEVEAELLEELAVLGLQRLAVGVNRT